MLAPEHPELERIAAGTGHEQAVRDYVNEAARPPPRSAATRTARRPALPLGRTVTNPVNGEQIPMFVSDYVLMEYGTGALMAVPAHDERDYEFAQAFGLAIRRVIEPAEGEAPEDEPFVAHSENERLVNSGQFGGLTAPEAIGEITTGSRRRAGASRRQLPPARLAALTPALLGLPDPLRLLRRCGIVPVPEDQLPVELPDVEDYAPKGKSPLATAEEWVNTECPKCGGPAGARPTRWTPSSTRPGTSCATSTRTTTRPPWAARSPTTGCRSTSTSAASSTRFCT